MDVEMANPGAYGVEVWDLAGDLVGKAYRKNAVGGWASFNFRGSWDMPLIPDGMYRIRLTNLSGGTRRARQGSLQLTG
jgi:hypothetical protein